MLQTQQIFPTVFWAFGVHGSGQAFDGHPGWDIEYRIGASIIAPADGTILNIAPDVENPLFYTVRMEHRGNNYWYNTALYTTKLTRQDFIGSK